jgi:hypothetical protein
MALAPALDCDELAPVDSVEARSPWLRIEKTPHGDALKGPDRILTAAMARPSMADAEARRHESV